MTTIWNENPCFDTISEHQYDFLCWSTPNGVSPASQKGTYRINPCFHPPLSSLSGCSAVLSGFSILSVADASTSICPWLCTPPDASLFLIYKLSSSLSFSQLLSINVNQPLFLINALSAFWVSASPYQCNNRLCTASNICLLRFELLQTAFAAVQILIASGPERNRHP